tara:strand:- start:131 stop:682 length:552 start_codon:yes stop_codon:yes gene_type:complete
MEKIIKGLKDANCIKEGNFQLRNGEYSKYYFDMKNLVSHPKLLTNIGDEIYNKFIKDKIEKNKNNNEQNKQIDNDKSQKIIRICGVPLGGLPIAIYISTKYNIPMIMVRNKVKNYGTQKQIEGEYNENDDCIIIEDVITTGGSVKESLEILKDKLNVIGICAILNRSNITKIQNINVYNLINN